jgi:hypothetical protein
MASEMSLVLDHLIWATPDLERGRARWAELTGTAAAPGGAHPGRGTRNALVPLQSGCYLEILAPDPAQELAGTAGAELAGLAGERLWTFCCRGQDLDVLATRARALGLSVDGPQPCERLRPDGVRLQWKLLYLTNHRFSRLLPFFIDWQNSPHPSAASKGERFSLTRLAVSHPDAELQQLYAQLDIPVTVSIGPPALRAELEVAARTLTLTS